MIGMDNASLEDFAQEAIQLSAPLISGDFPDRCPLCGHPEVDTEQARLVYEMACGLMDFLGSYKTN